MNIQQLFTLGMKRRVSELLDFPLGPVVNLGCGKHVLNDCINLDWPQWDAEQYQIELPRSKIAGDASPQCWPSQKDWSPEAIDFFGNQLVRCPDGFLAGIHAYHFLEHLHDPRRMLREMQRCLMPGGVINICVPHYWGSMAHQDLDHKHNFALDTWTNAFNNQYYSKDREGWQLQIHFNMLMAVTERNAAILTQLVKIPL